MRRKLTGRILCGVLALAMLFSMWPAQPDVSAAGTANEETARGQTTIAEAFRQKNLSDLYENGKLTLSGRGGLSAAYSKSADGLLINGSKTDLANTVFSFADKFDFSEGVVGRLNVNAMAAKGNIN